MNKLILIAVLFSILGCSKIASKKLEIDGFSYFVSLYKISDKSGFALYSKLKNKSSKFVMTMLDCQPEGREKKLFEGFFLSEISPLAE